MTTAVDYLTSVLSSLKKARQNIVALSTIPGTPNGYAGYEKACPNPADVIEIANAHSAIEDAESEVDEALKILRTVNG